LRRHPEDAAPIRPDHDQPTADPDVEPLTGHPAQRRHDRPVGDPAPVSNVLHP
jgi:hypothetical protein